MSQIMHTTNVFAVDTYQRVQDVDEMVVLDFSTLMQYNKIKFTVLSDGIEALNSPIEPESEEIAIVPDKDDTKNDDDEFFE